jgi:hypothetical protein
MLRRMSFLIALIALPIAVAPGALAASSQVDSPATTIVVVADSCTGTLACQGAGTVGTDSCNGTQACQGSGDVGNNSCNGSQACQAAVGSVGNNSCNASLACESAAMSIGSNSCNGPSNCSSATSVIGDCMFNDVVPEACEVHQADGLVRRSGGQRKGNDIYNVDGANQTTFANAPRYRRGACRTTYVYVQNDGNVADTFTFESSQEGTSGITLQFFTRNPLTDVTALVDAGTFTSPPVEPGKVYGITGRLCIASDAPHHSQMHVLVTVASNVIETTVGPQVVSGDTVGFQIRGK